MRRLILFLIASTLLIAPSVAAQTLTISIRDPPAAFPDLVSNATSSVAINVAIELSGVVCPAATTIPVTLAITSAGAPSFFMVAPDVETFSASVPAGAYPGDPTNQGAPGTKYTGTATANLVATTTSVETNASVPVSITASASPPADCQPAGGAAKTSEAVVIFANMTAPPPPPAPEPEPEKKGLPAPGLVPAALAVLGAVAIRRARRS